ncbi:Sulfatase domain-containing protein [Alteromonas macleodii]
MDAAKLCGLFLLSLLCVVSCGGDSQPPRPAVPEEEQLSRSYSITLPEEITSDDTVSLSVNASNDSNAQKVTIESWNTSLGIPLSIVNTSDGVYSFIAPQVRKRTPFIITAKLVNETGTKFNVSAQSLILPSKPNLIVIFTDDQGYADVGAHNIVSDINTPNIDKLAANGVLFSNGYITAPQCTPSRAGMITGVYQQRFGVDDNRYTPIPENVITMGDRFSELGYTTGLVGKWHLEIDQNSKPWFKENFPNTPISEFNLGNLPSSLKERYYPSSKGYKYNYFGYANRYWTNFDLKGNETRLAWVSNSDYRLDVISDAATQFIDINHDEPFYLHVAHYAPHVPLEATEDYLSLFPEQSANRRRYALAMMYAVDAGVGSIVSKLEEYGILDNTIIAFISDNGAPIGLDFTDAPITEKETWNGSLNTPLIGEKGMLTDGGIKVPFIVHWPDKLQGNTVVDEPVISLDVLYSALKSAGASESTLSELDGVEIFPTQGFDTSILFDRPLFWRFWNQSAVRLGNYKYLKMGAEHEFLFDMSSEEANSNNLISDMPDKTEELKRLYNAWNAEMFRQPQQNSLNSQEREWLSFYLTP